ncbi:MAG: hydroxymethylglutaryl-CoA synthase [Halobacteriota archaeon]
MIGIVSYGVYVPVYRIRVEEIAKQWGEKGANIKAGLMVEEKSVPDLDEDAATMAVEAARAAIQRASLNPRDIGAIYVGSESHPYAVKPTATIVAAAIDASTAITAADFEFACKAGTATIQTCMGLVALSKIKYGLAIGTDASQASPGDALEYTAAAGSAAFVIGQERVVAEIEDYASFTTDTPDFWRRDLQKYPSHSGRFTGEPAYFRHTISATEALLEKTGLQAADFDFAVFHQPNGKFPLKAANSLGFTTAQVKTGLMVPFFGNMYSASSLIGLAAVLDKASPSQRILLTSFGSGAGSDSFAFRVTDYIEEVREKAKKVEHFIISKKYLDYAGYAKHQGKIRM